jgi:hypothetical protein
MKTRLLFVLSILSIAGAGCSWLSQGGGSGQGNICYVSFAGDAVPQPKLNQIINLLQQDTKYPQNYKVRRWENGKPVLTIGKMKIAQTELKKMDTNAKHTGLTAATYRVGAFITCDPKSNPWLIDAKRLAQEVDKIVKSK